MTAFVGEGGDIPPRVAGPPRQKFLPAPCRHCGGPSWLTDELGTLHPCCQLWAGLLPDKPCPACTASETLNREHRRRGLQKRIKNGSFISAGEAPPESE